MQWTLFIHYYFGFDYLSYRLKEKNKFERKSTYHDQNVSKIKWSKTSVSQTHSAVKRGVHLIGGFQESLCRNSGKFTANAHDIFTKSHPFRCIVKSFPQNILLSQVSAFFSLKKFEIACTQSKINKNWLGKHQNNFCIV